MGSGRGPPMVASSPPWHTTGGPGHDQEGEAGGRLGLQEDVHCRACVCVWEGSSETTSARPSQGSVRLRPQEGCGRAATPLCTGGEATGQHHSHPSPQGSLRPLCQSLLDSLWPPPF